MRYLKTEDESNQSQNEETEQHVDDGENQVVVWLYPTGGSISNRWLLSHYYLYGGRERERERERERTLISDHCMVIAN